MKSIAYFIVILTATMAMTMNSESARAAEVIKSTLDSELVPGPVEYAVVAPEGFRQMKELPLVLNLHGGGGSRDALIRQAEIWDALWASGDVPPAIVAMASVRERSFYMNFKDGSERWEDFMMQEFLPHLRAAYPADPAPARTFITGISMGGMGSLRIAFRHPEAFGAVAAMEPGIEPILAFADMKPKHRFWRADDLMEKAYGDPVDEAYWAANNPATMAQTNAAAIKASGLQIYIEAGDEDQFWLYEGTEFLHRVLWDERIKHEYHLVRGADHVGPSMAQRVPEAIRFLFRSYNPWPVTPRMKLVDRYLDPMKARIDGTDHYNEKDE